MSSPFEAVMAPAPAWSFGDMSQGQAAPATASEEPLAGSEEPDDGPAPGEEATTRRSVEEIERLLDEVEGALGRLDAGTYGVCDGCGTPLDDEHLAHSPVATRCPTCAADPSEV